MLYIKKASLCLLFYISNLESLQLKAAVDSWNAIVADVRNKIAYLRVSAEVYLHTGRTSNTKSKQLRNFRTFLTSANFISLFVIVFIQLVLDINQRLKCVTFQILIPIKDNSKVFPYLAFSEFQSHTKLNVPISYRIK